MFLITSFLLSFMAISGFFGRFNITRVECKIEFPNEIYANNDFPISINLINQKKYYPVFLIKIKIFNKSILFPFFEKSDKKLLNVNLPKRGRYVLDKIEISSPFPFNFFVRYYTFKKNIEFIVFPEPKKGLMEYLFDRKNKKGEIETNLKKGYEGEMVSIKDYILGTPLKYVDWKSSAKTGVLKIKELSSLIDRPIIIDFDSIFMKNIEDKLSLITFFIIDSIKRNVPIGLKINKKLYKPEISIIHKINLLTELALYEKI